MKKVFVFVFVSVVLIACSKTNEVTESSTNPPSTGGTTSSCDTINMKYAANVQPIIQANCYRCHGNGQAQGGTSIDSYSKVVLRVNNGSLIGAITHASGYTPMPYDRPKLSDCDINKIKAWIARGSLNN